MEQNTKYFAKTASALQNLHQSIAELDVSAENLLQIAQKDQAELNSLKEKIKTKALAIDSIITKLNGALK